MSQQSRDTASSGTYGARLGYKRLEGPLLSKKLAISLSLKLSNIFMCRLLSLKYYLINAKRVRVSLLRTSLILKTLSRP
jgi:hypothetical protein